MRKYYKPGNARKRDPATKFDQEVDPWFILRSFVHGAAGHFSWDDLCAILSSVERKSVKSYLDVVERLESHLQMYDKTTDVGTVFVHRQVCALLKKFPFVKTDLETDPRSRAIEKWLKAEDQCRQTNDRIGALAPSELPHWVFRARRLIADVLGDLTPELVMSIINSGQHGPGSTLTSRGNRVTSYYKYLDVPYSVSVSARMYSYAAISSDHKWVDYLESTGRRTEIPPSGSSRVQKELMLFKDTVIEKDSDKITFVPKDCRTDRPIAVGAGLNLFLQLGVKSYMEKRLKTVGVDLRSQEKNRLFAKIGSEPRDLDPLHPAQFSTIDLASASDTVSVELVRLLLDNEWFAFLDDLRHKTGTIEGEHVTYEKFSAMGNGFTFPLESLIFWAVSKAATEDAGLRCTPNDITVYGDDIIVRLRSVPYVLPALLWCGFTVNEEKSFISGYFKESCGEDYFLGHDVRPLYLKRRMMTYADAYYVLNWISRKTVNSNFRTYLRSVYKILLEKIPAQVRSYGPMFAMEDSLAVPLSFMNKEGLRPFLSLSEKASLSSARLLHDEDSYLQCMYAFSYLDSAIPYRARESVNYMIELRNNDSSQTPVWHYKKHHLPDVLSVKDGRFAYRRNAVKRVIKVSPILNWNDTYSYHVLYKHPILDC